MGCIFSFNSEKHEKYKKIGYLDSSMIEDQLNLLSEQPTFEGNSINDNRFFMMPGYQEAMKKLQAIVKSEGSKSDAGIELKYMRMQFSDYQIKLLETSRLVNDNAKPKSLIQYDKQSEMQQQQQQQFPKKKQQLNQKELIKVIIKSAPIEEASEEQEDKLHDSDEEDGQGQGSEMFVETRTKSVPHLIEGSFRHLEENNLKRWFNKKRVLVVEVQSLILYQSKEINSNEQSIQIKLSTKACNLTIEAAEEFKEKQENEYECSQKIDQDEWEIITKDNKSNHKITLASDINVNNNGKGPNESTATGLSRKENYNSQSNLNENVTLDMKNKPSRHKKQVKYQLMQVREIELLDAGEDDRITVWLGSKTCNPAGKCEDQQLGISQSFQFQELISQKVHSKQIRIVDKQQKVIALLNSRIQLIWNPKDLLKTQLEETSARVNQIQILQKEVANASRPPSYIEMNQNKTEQAVEIAQSPPEISTSSIFFDGKYFLH